MLEERTSSSLNWMGAVWEQLTYLRTRTTMAIHINWLGVLLLWGVELTNVQAAALKLVSILKMKVTLEEGTWKK